MSRTVFGRTKQQFMSGMLAAYQGINAVEAIESVGRWEAWFDKHAADGEEECQAHSTPTNAVEPTSLVVASAVLDRTAAALDDMCKQLGCIPFSYLPNLVQGLREEQTKPGYVESLLAQPGDDKCAN